MKTFVPGRKVDDAIEAVVEFDERHDRHDRGDAARARAPQRVPVGDQRLEGLALVRHGAHERAAGLPRRRRPRARREDRARHRGRPSRSSSTGGRRATSSAGATPSCTRSCTCSTRSRTTATSRPYGGRLRGRLPRQRDLRRDRPLVERAAAASSSRTARSPRVGRARSAASVRALDAGADLRERGLARRAVSSANGAKPQSSVVPSRSSGMYSAASSTRSRTSSADSTLRVDRVDHADEDPLVGRASARRSRAARAAGRPRSRAGCRSARRRCANSDGSSST